jgi:hypothetical protein
VLLIDFIYVAVITWLLFGATFMQRVAGNAT